MVFAFLLIARRKWFRYRGDVISFYAFLYACGRLVIEDFRMDSLYASSNVRISQLLSVAICLLLLLRYMRKFYRQPPFLSFITLVPAAAAILYDTAMAFWMTNLIAWHAPSVFIRFVILSVCGLLNILALVMLYGRCAEGEPVYADNKD